MKRLLWLVFKRANMPRDLRVLLLHYCRHVLFDYETAVLRRERVKQAAKYPWVRMADWKMLVMENLLEQVDEYQCQCGTCTYWSFKRGPYLYRWRLLTDEQFLPQPCEDEQ